VPIVYISEVEILDDSDQPTSACSFRGISGGKFLNVLCENGSCENLGFLSNQFSQNSFNNTFSFSCSQPGDYKFKFKGELLDIIHWSNQELITIFSHTYSCEYDNPIPGEIWCLEDLINMSSDSQILMRDLDFENNSDYRDINNKILWTTGEGWAPLNKHFRVALNSMFNGNNKNISNLYINKPNSNSVGFFNSVWDNVQNLNLIDVNIIGGNDVGGLGGTICGGQGVHNIKVTGVVVGYERVGGIFGMHTNYQYAPEHYKNDWNSVVDVYGFDSVGGVLGRIMLLSGCMYPSCAIHFNNITGSGNIHGRGVRLGGLYGDSYYTPFGIEVHLHNNSFVGNIFGGYNGSVLGSSIGGLIGRVFNFFIHDSFFDGLIDSQSDFDPNNMSGTGGLVGVSGAVFINNSFAKGTINNSNSRGVGGLIGSVSVATSHGFGTSVGRIIDSYSDANVVGRKDVGGLVGYARTFDINRSFSNSSVYGVDNVGGLIGDAGGASRTKISDSYSLGPVYRSIGSSETIASFIGVISGGYIIKNSYSIGPVFYINSTNPSNRGFSSTPITPYLYYSIYDYGANCYWDMESSSQASTPGPGPNWEHPVTGLTTTQMKNQANFPDWDFTNIWDIDSTEIINNGYPYLRNNPPN